MKKKDKMIRNFEAISKYDIYSKYNVILEKKFKDKSLKSFIDNLRNKRFKEKEPFLEEFYKKHPYDFELKKNIENENEDFLNFINEEKDYSPKNIKNELRCSFSTKRYKEPEFPDPFKYNPNYNSIYKKIPSFKINPKKSEIKNLKKIKNFKDIFKNENQIKTKKNIMLKENVLSGEENKMIKNKINKANSDKNMILLNNNINQLKIKEKSKRLDLPLITCTNITKDLKKENNKNHKYNTIETYNIKDNHALRFSKYLTRKNIFETITKEVSYLEPYDYNSDVKKAIDFAKMNSRNDKSIINISSLDVPSLCKYYPKYTLVENNARNVLFSPFGENQNIKKNILQKMLGSYQVFSEYKTIDNDKLFNDHDLIIKQLIINHNLKI